MCSACVAVVAVDGLLEWIGVLLLVVLCLLL